MNDIIEKEFTTTKFGKTYLRIILGAASTPRTKITQTLELHHILPKAKNVFPEYSNLNTYKWNGVLLTPREHFICHSLLVQHYRKTNEQTKFRRMSRAFFFMSKTKTINSYMYEVMKIDLKQGIGSKPKGFMVGDSNSNAKEIEIFVCNNILRATSNGSFAAMLKHHKFPRNYFRRLFKNKILGTEKSYPDYIGWYIKEKHISICEIKENTEKYIHECKKKMEIPKIKRKFSDITKKKMSISQNGISTYKDKNGINYRVNVNDSRVLSGELISVNKGVGYKDDLDLIEKRSIAIKGMNNPSAKIIHIYNNLDELVFTCNGSFERTCKENKLPLNPLKNSYLNNSERIYDGIISGAAYTRLINNGNIKFQNWYAKIENQC